MPKFLGKKKGIQVPCFQSFAKIHAKVQEELRLQNIYYYIRKSAKSKGSTFKKPPIKLEYLAILQFRCVWYKKYSDNCITGIRFNLLIFPSCVMINCQPSLSIYRRATGVKIVLMLNLLS